MHLLNRDGYGHGYGHGYGYGHGDGHGIAFGDEGFMQAIYRIAVYEGTMKTTCQYLNCKHDAVKIRIASNGTKQPRCERHAGTKPYEKRTPNVSKDRIITRIIIDSREEQPERRLHERQTTMLCLPDLPAPKGFIACWRPERGVFTISKNKYRAGMKPQNVYQIQDARELAIQYKGKFGPIMFISKWVEAK